MPTPISLPQASQEVVYSHSFSLRDLRRSMADSYHSQRVAQASVSSIGPGGLGHLHRRSFHFGNHFRGRLLWHPDRLQIRLCIFFCQGTLRLEAPIPLHQQNLWI